MSRAPWDRDIAVQDTLGALTDDSPDAQAVLDRVRWQPERFEAHVRPGQRGIDATIRFPSPLPQGIQVSDNVEMDWYAARDANGLIKRAQAVLVLDILQGGNIVSAFVARALCRAGIHGFVLHMPHNGRRAFRPLQAQYDWKVFLPSLRQAVADARRARDVIAALPEVTGPIGIEGTSLGGFIATIAAALDGAFDPLLICLAGGNVYEILKNGKVDAARVYRKLHEAGIDDNRLREELWQSEPLNIAHRLDPQRTWMMMARRDQVVPAFYSRALAAAAKLPPSHVRPFAGCHYSCVISAPFILRDLIRITRSRNH